MANTIELARDADNRIVLTPEQATAVARWFVDTSAATADDCEVAHAIGAAWHEDDITAALVAAPAALPPTGAGEAVHRNHWTEAEAEAAGDMELPRCIHGQPRNVYCGRCES